MNSSNLYKSYIKETENKEFYETKYGFFIYKKIGEEFYVAEFYVLPEFRKSVIAYKFIDIVKDLAKKGKCSFVSSRVLLSTINSGDAVLFNLRVGFKIHAAHDNTIWFKYDL